MTLQRRVVVALLPVVIACGSTPSVEPPQAAQLTRAVSAPERLAPPEDLPGPARALLHTRMASHAQEMGQLMSAIMVLDYPRIGEEAKAVVEEPRFARPLTGDATELNSLLPAKFFDFDDRLRETAGTLAVAAEKQDAFAVARAYGELSEGCVGCHATYRAGRQSPAVK